MHFGGHFTLSLSHAVYVICPLAHTLRHARIYSHILHVVRVGINAHLYYLLHNY